MSVKILHGSLDSLELLLFLSEEEFITSGDIRKKFEKVKAGTLDAKLRKLHHEGLIEIKHLELLRAGDDRYGYKLTKKGIDTRTKLIEKTMRIVDSQIKQIITQNTKSETGSTDQYKQAVIDEFLEEFTDDCKLFVSQEILSELQRIVKNLLNFYL